MPNRYSAIDIFPTRAIKFDLSDTIDQHDVESMIQDIDRMVEENVNMQLTPETPRHQSLPVLFNDQRVPGHYWNKLAQTFVNCCFEYVQTTPDFVRQPNAVELTGVRGWFFKSYRSVNQTQTNPWHDHSPALLTGVFYLRVPGDHSREGGTMLRDPRGAGSSIYRDVDIAPTELSWLIFPGWLSHCAHVCDSEEPRYVIAADCYVKIRSQ